MAAWGQYLAFLEREGILDRTAGPGDRVTFERCGQFILAMRERLAPKTIETALAFLAMAATVMAPEKDWNWIRKHPLRPSRAEVRATRKEVTPPDAAELLGAAFAACESIDTENPSLDDAIMFRDCVLVALAVCLAVRRRNLAEMRVGEHLILGGGCARAVFADTKNHVGIDTPLSPMLSGHLIAYVEKIRPVIQRDKIATDWLWINEDGTPVSYGVVYLIFRRRGAQLIGRPLSPHCVRHSLATGTLQADPTRLEAASAALGHRSTSITRRAYDHSGSAASNAVWLKLLERKRRGRA